MQAEVPLRKIEAFREILEENAFCLTDCCNMHAYVPFILKEEEGRIRCEIDGRHLSVTFEATSRLGEALPIILHFVSDDWIFQQRSVRVQMLSKSLVATFYNQSFRRHERPRFNQWRRHADTKSALSLDS